MKKYNGIPDKYDELLLSDEIVYDNKDDIENFDFYNRNIRAHREFFVSQSIVADIFSTFNKEYNKLSLFIEIYRPGLRTSSFNKSL